MNAEENRLLVPRLAAFAAIAIWGVSFVATKVALAEISPTTLIATRFAMGVVLLHAILAVRREPLLPARDAVPALLLMGFVGIFVHQMVQGYGLTMTTAMKTGWLIGLTPIWSSVLAAVFLGERFGPMKLAGLVLGFVGALLVVTHGVPSRELLSLPSTKGDALVLLSTLNWAAYTILGHGTIRRLGALRATSGSMLFGWILLLPLFFVGGGLRELVTLSPAGWGAVLFLGIGASGLGYLFWYGALEKIESSRVAAFLYIEPLFTLAAAALVLGERITAGTVVGGIVVLAGVLLVQKGKK